MVIMDHADITMQCISACDSEARYPRVPSAAGIEYVPFVAPFQFLCIPQLVCLPPLFISTPPAIFPYPSVRPVKVLSGRTDAMAPLPGLRMGLVAASPKSRPTR
jgi:hypothetical protein